MNLSILNEIYFHNVSIPEFVSPFYNQDIMVSLIQNEFLTIGRSLENEKKIIEKYDLAYVRKLQNNKENEILKIINEYGYDIFGDLYKESNIKLEWVAPQERAMPSMQTEKRPGPVNESYLWNTIRRAELAYLLTQGFGIIYMEGFFRMMHDRLVLIHTELPAAYRAFHLRGRGVHQKTFEDVLKGKRFSTEEEVLIESGQSLGRVYHSTGPVSNDDGSIYEMESSALARSDIGIVLAHEMLKGVFQTLCPFTKLYESYLNDAEIDILRKTLNSFWAEIRQFVIGPCFLKKFQNYKELNGINTSPASLTFYQAIEDFVLLPEDKLESEVRKIIAFS